MIANKKKIMATWDVVTKYACWWQRKQYNAIMLSLELEFPINLDANVKHPFFPLNSVILKCFVTLEENTSTRRQSQSQNVAMPR